MLFYKITIAILLIRHRIGVGSAETFSVLFLNDEFLF